jgi:hypothetical protein
MIAFSDERGLPALRVDALIRFHRLVCLELFTETVPRSRTRLCKVMEVDDVRLERGVEALCLRTYSESEQQHRHSLDTRLISIRHSPRYELQTSSDPDRNRRCTSPRCTTMTHPMSKLELTPKVSDKTYKITTVFADALQLQE